MGNRGGGWIDQWRQGTLAVRGLGHLGAAALTAAARPPGRRWPVGIALAASLAGDATLALRAGTAARSRSREAAVNLVDLAVWGALAGPGRGVIRPGVVATVVPTAIESGFRLGAGIDAVPIVEPLRRWEPAWDPPLPRVLSLPWSALGRHGGVAAFRTALGVPPIPRMRPERAVRLVGELAADVVPPMATAWTVRRAMGKATGMGLLGWGAFGTIGGYALARTRDDAQRSTRDLWQRRCEDILDEQRVAARVQAALSHNLLSVDPRAMLRAFAANGFEPAHRALLDLDAAAAATHSLGTGTEGTTLISAVEGRPIAPEEDRFRFVEERQVRPIRTWLEEVEDDPSAELGAEPVVVVVRTLGRDLTLRYGRRELVLRGQPPELAVRLEPTLPAVALGSVWTAATILPSLGGAPPIATAVASLLDGAAVWRLARKVALERRADRTAALLVGGGAVLLDVAIGLRQRRLVGPAGLPLCPGTGATQPLALLLAASWHELGVERWALVVGGLGAWAYSFVGAGHRDWGLMANELAFLCMPAAAAATLAADARREAAALDDGLDDWLAAELEGEARALAGRQVDRFIRSLDVVREGLAAGLLDLDGDDAAEQAAEYLAEARRLAATDPLDVINW